MGWAPSTTLAQEPTKREIRAEEVAEEGEFGNTGIDDADESDEIPVEAAGPEMTPEERTEAELDEAMEAIKKAEAELEEAKRQMELMGRKMAPAPVPVPGTDVGLVEVDGRAKKLQWSLNDDGTLYMRMLMWLQVWTRAIQLNPGTEVQGDDNPWYGDVGLRRARLLWFGQIFPRTFILLHVGINNQTFRNARKPQVFFHDAWMEFQVSRNKAFYLGGGLIYWNGISRQTNASTITFMSLDAPIMNWPLIEREDQFARQLGIYAKGKLGLFDYRVAVTRPFTAFDVSLTGNTPAPPPQDNIGNYRDTNSWAYTGYFMFQFQDEESNVLPYTVGTYIGAKRVLNLGFGGYLHPGGVQYGESEVDPDTGEVTILSSKARMLGILGADLFLDQPFGGDDGGAVTWYGVYQYQDFGPNHIRNVGIMNPGSGGTAFTQFASGSSAGNAYPMIGTGNHLYTEFGVLLPGHLGKEIKFQPYVNWQGSAFMGFGCGPRNDGEFASVPCTWMHHVGVGLNMFIHRHNAKVTIEYRNRPIFNEDRSLESRKGNSFVMQWHIFI
jgi:hypothetical protein